MTVSAAELRAGDEPAIAAEHPFRVLFRPTNPSPAPPSLQIEPSRWSGPAGTMELSGTWTGDGTGQLRWQARRLKPGRFRDWIPGRFPTLDSAMVEELQLEGRWEARAVEASLATRGFAEFPGLGRFHARLQADTGPDRVVIRELRVGRNDDDAVTAAAALPARLRPEGPWVQWLADAALEGTLTAPAGSWLWAWLAERGWRTEGAEARLNLGGTGGRPEGLVTASARRATWLAATNQMPAVENLALDLAISPDGFQLSRFNADLAGQPVRISGAAPRATVTEVGPWWRGWLPDLTAADGRLLVERADLGPLLQPWQEFLLTAGVLRADLHWKRDHGEGWLELEGASLRPIHSFGAVRDIGLRLELQGAEVQVAHGAALVNGQPVQIGGRGVLPGAQPATLQLQIQGTNVPVLRSAEAVLRANLNLSVAATNGAPAVLRGEVGLRESMILIDVRDLVSVDLERAERRPPFFSVTRPPFLADTALNVHVHGSRFGRVVSPAFQGHLSAEARLLGTLRNPRLLGDFAADDGQISFPFGRLNLEQARVRFTETDPYRPVLEGRAEGMNYGYTVTLQLEGTLSAPEVQFSALPPLSTGEIVQMLTAGVVPRGEYAFSDSSKVQRVGTYLARDFLGAILGNSTSESRLTMRSGQNVSSNGRLTYGIEYQLSDRWFLVGEYDRWSQVNAGVRWRLLQR